MLSEPLTESPCLVCGLGRLSWNKRCLGWCARDGWKWAVCREERRRLGQSESRGQSRPGGRSMHPSIYLRYNLYLRSYTFNITRTSARLQPNAEETAVGRKDAQTADIKGMVGHIKDFQIYPEDRKFKQTTARHSSVFLQCTICCQDLQTCLAWGQTAASLQAGSPAGSTKVIREPKGLTLLQF